MPPAKRRRTAARATQPTTEQLGQGGEQQQIASAIDEQHIQATAPCTPDDATAAATSSSGVAGGDRGDGGAAGSSAAAALPLPDDMTPEEMANRAKNPTSEDLLATSTVKQYDQAKRKYWFEFCKHAKWDAVEKANFLDEAGNPRDGTFRQLFCWMYEQDGMSKGKMKPLLAWAQHELNKQRVARHLQPMDNHVCQVPGVASRKAELWTQRRQQHMEHMTDLQAEIESDMGAEKMLQCVDRCLKLQVPETTPMFGLQTYFELRACFQQCCRHDDLRLEVFAHIFTRDVRVGPRMMPMLCNVTDGGKTNANGRISYSAVVPHKNPVMCCIFAKGILLGWRFNVMKVKVPDLLDKEDIFKRPTLRQGHDEFGRVSYDSSRKIMNRLFTAENIVVTKCLHQGRGEGQRNLDQLGVDVELIKRLCKYVHDDQVDSYLLNPPIAALLASAGFDHTLPASARAAHLIVVFDTLLIGMLWPWLPQQMAAIDAEFTKVPNGKEAKRKALYCARGCGKALKLIAEVLIRGAAARPRDAENHIIADSEPIYKLYHQFNNFFQLPFWKCKAFLEFAGRVRAAEEREIKGMAEEESEGAATKLTPITERLSGGGRRAACRAAHSGGEGASGQARWGGGGGGGGGRASGGQHYR